MTERPAVRYFVAIPLKDGKVMAISLVRLETAEDLRTRAGYVVVGPDPHDMQNLAAWEREQWQSRFGPSGFD